MGFIVFIIIFIVIPILIRKKKEEEKNKNKQSGNAPSIPERQLRPRETVRFKKPESLEEEYGRDEAPERTRAIFDGEGYDSGAVYDGVRKRR